MSSLHSSIEILSIVHPQHLPIFNPEAVRAALMAAGKKRQMSSVNQVTRFEPALNGRITGFFGGLSHRLAQYKTYRRTLDELSGLSDRELSDLGVSRHSLRSIAYKAAYDG